MTKPRTHVTIIVLAIVALVVLLVWRGWLTPAAEEEQGEAESIVAVHTGKIVVATLQRLIVAYGTVEPEPATAGNSPAGARVASPFAGVVAETYCHEGQKVRKGDPLFRLDSRVADLLAAKAKETLAFAEIVYEREKKLLLVEGTSQKNFLAAEQTLKAARNDLANSEVQRSMLRISAPLDGTVLQVNVRPGEAVEPSTVLAEMMNLGRLIVTASVPSAEAGLLQNGQAVELDTGRVPAVMLRDAKATATSGRLVYVGSQIDPRSDTVPVRVSFPAAAGLRPGQFLSLRIICAEHHNCLAVPEAAVVADAVDGESGAIVLVQGDRAVRMPVKIGFREAGLVEVAAVGLQPGMTIVSEDAYAIGGETKIRIITL
jgi:membrane fusion protein (multidrug efflux system)